ncbi:hypothetical protein ACFWF3_35500, partial [Nocardia sp. NPDC060220]
MSLPGTPKTAAEIQQDWDTNPRWKGLTRTYSAEQVSKLQGNVVEEHTLARRGSEILWDLVNNEDYINSLGALTGNQAVQQVRAGLKAIYLGGARTVRLHPHGGGVGVGVPQYRSQAQPGHDGSLRQLARVRN